MKPKQNTSKAKKTAKKTGRPPLNCNDYADTICAMLASGQSLNSICQQPDMPSLETVYRWLRVDEEFRESYTRAREEQAETMADQIIQIADEEDDPNNKRIRIDARKWVAAKLKPMKYSDRQQIDHEHSGSVQLIQLDQLTTHGGDE